jgi:hypothetical protein
MLLRGALAIDHVPEVVFALLLVRMLFDEVLFVWELQNDGEQAQQREDHVGVKCPCEDLDFWEMCLHQVRLWVPALEVLGELRDIEHFDVVLDGADLATPRPAPAIIVGVA